ncbi:unnamed protein product, partial [Onchocerca ochengi]
PKTPEIQEKALALFDCGSQSSFVSNDLAKQLNLKGNEDEIRIASIGNEIPKPCLTTKVEIAGRMGETEVIRFEAHTVDYLINKLQVVGLNDHDLASINDLDQLMSRKVIGNNLIFELTEIGKAQNFKSGFSLLHTAWTYVSRKWIHNFDVSS